MTKSENVRVLVVDDHMVVRAGLVHVLREVGRFEVVGEAESGERALAECQRLKPDILIIDVMMPGMGGRTATKTIRHRFPDTKVIALSAFADPRLHRELVDAGASAFLAKSVSASELIEVIERVHHGREPGASSVQSASPPTPELKLGPQQRRVLALLTKGYTNNEIAEFMGVSMPTARYHVSALLLKLGVSNRAEAAAMAERNDLVSDGDF